MRGAAIINKARCMQLADRHARKFNLYPLIGIVVDKFMRGAKEATLPNISMKDFDVLKTFYGITIDPGPRCDVTPLHHKGPRKYAPRPKAYRPGTPILINARYRKMNDRTTAKLRTLEEASQEETEIFGASWDSSISNATDRHRALMDRGWILVAAFKVNPYLGE